MDNNPKRKILFGIDSATLTIPMHANIEVSDWLTSTEYYKTIKGTGETKEIRETPHETIRENGISTRYQIHSAQFDTIPNVCGSISPNVFGTIWQYLAEFRFQLFTKMSSWDIQHLKPCGPVMCALHHRIL